MNTHGNLIKFLNNSLKNESCFSAEIEVENSLSLELIGKILSIHFMESNDLNKFDEEELEKAILGLRCKYPKLIDAEIDYMVLGLLHWYYSYSGSGAIMKQEVFLHKVLLNNCMNKFQS